MSHLYSLYNLKYLGPQKLSICLGSIRHHHQNIDERRPNCIRLKSSEGKKDYEKEAEPSNKTGNVYKFLRCDGQVNRKVNRRKTNGSYSSRVTQQQCNSLKGLKILKKVIYCTCYKTIPMNVFQSLSVIYASRRRCKKFHKKW